MAANRIFKKIRQPSAPQRKTLLLWTVSAVLGVLLTIAMVLLATVMQAKLLLFVALTSLFPLIAFLLSFRWRRNLQAEEIFIADRELLIRQYGRRYLSWFVGHSLFWFTVAGGLAIFLVIFFGLSPFALAISAGLTAGAMCSLIGLMMAQDTMLLGICWKTDWDAMAGRWTRINAALILQDRYRVTQAQPSLKHTFDRMIAILTLGSPSSGMTGDKVDLWEDGSLFENWRREFWHRVQVLLGLFLITMLLCLCPSLSWPGPGLPRLQPLWLPMLPRKK